MKYFKDNNSNSNPFSKINRNIVVLGDHKTGKTTLLKTFTENYDGRRKESYFERYIQTIGIQKIKI